VVNIAVLLKTGMICENVTAPLTLCSIAVALLIRVVVDEKVARSASQEPSERHAMPGNPSGPCSTWSRRTMLPKPLIVLGTLGVSPYSNRNAPSKVNESPIPAAWTAGLLDSRVTLLVTRLVLATAIV
jgi:hypothetical protein